MDGINAYHERVRVAFGGALTQDDLMLEIVDHGIKMLRKGDQVNALTGQERVALEEARKHIREARKRVRAVARRIADETE